MSSSNYYGDWPSDSTAGLFVVVSWISFVVPPDVIPGRMALLITLFLVLVNIFNTVTTNTPKAEGNPIQQYWPETWIFNVSTGLTAIETWMLSCLLFVFGALVGIINYYKIITQHTMTSVKTLLLLLPNRLPSTEN